MEQLPVCFGQDLTSFSVPALFRSVAHGLKGWVLHTCPVQARATQKGEESPHINSNLQTICLFCLFLQNRRECRMLSVSTSPGGRFPPPSGWSSGQHRGRRLSDASF